MPLVHTNPLDAIFGSLADPTRRDILLRVTQQPLSISELADPYDMSFAAVAKHVAVLETAHLVSKQRQGKQQLVVAVPATISIAKDQLDKYQQLWEDRFAALDAVLESTAPKPRQ